MRSTRRHLSFCICVVILFAASSKGAMAVQGLDPRLRSKEDRGMMQRIAILPASPSIGRAVAPVLDQTVTPAIGNRIATSIAPNNGKPVVLFFVQGSLCPHCMTQITEMARKLSGTNLDVSVISATPTEDLNAFPAVPFTLVADPEYKLFREYGVYEGEPKHGTIVLSADGREIFRNVGDEPFMDSQALVDIATSDSVQVVIAVRNTDEPVDDYITWAPTHCQIRIVNGTSGGADLRVTLTNDDPAAIPTGGDVAFSQSLSNGETATQTTLPLVVPQDGTAVDFFVAGSKLSRLTPASMSNQGRDAVIEVHQDDATGPKLADRSVMVRARRNISSMDDLELNEFLKAVADLHFDKHRYEWYVELHRLATIHEWPDQAHLGPAFIAWHRAFLLQFERELQVKYPHVSLPYWVQGTSQTFFSRAKLGFNSAGGSEFVQFERPNPLTLTGSPLYGWAIDLDHDSPVATGRMGFLRRAALDHAITPAPGFYEQWGTRLQMLSNFRDALPNRWEQGQPNGTNPNFNVERNPHNKGHQQIGPDLVWMENCRESNADPIFWVFHCNHDYLWAKWQRYHNRFETATGNDAHYWPSDSYTDLSANRNVPRGHHLNDPMWPWDGTTSADFPGERPDTNGFGPFPAAPYGFLWPPGAGIPRPADMIDYLGVGSPDHNLGFCYDDVPFGTETHEAIPAAMLAQQDATKLAVDVAFQEGVSIDVRLAAMMQLSNLPLGVQLPRMEALVQDRDAPVDLRTEALRTISVSAPQSAVRSIVGILDDPQTSPALAVAGIEQVGQLHHFSGLRHGEMTQLDAALRKVLADSKSAPVRTAALRQLSARGDPEAERILAGFLQEPSLSPLPVRDVISLLRFFPGQKEAIRKMIQSNNDEEAIESILSLFADKLSEPVRQAVATDATLSSAVRKAAIQSLIHDDSAAGPNTLISLFANTAEELDLRAEALAAAAVYFHRRADQLTAADRLRWVDEIKSVASGGKTTSELGALKDQLLSWLTR